MLDKPSSCYLWHNLLLISVGGLFNKQKQPNFITDIQKKIICVSGHVTVLEKYMIKLQYNFITSSKNGTCYFLSGDWWSWCTMPSPWRSTATVSPTTHWTSSPGRTIWWRKTTQELQNSPLSSTPSQTSATTSQRRCTKIVS